ncbi:MAG: hypothetical protein ACRD3N_01270 [Terracidiphilus sp.]
MPRLADEPTGSETSESFAPFGEVPGEEEGLQALFELPMGLVVVAPDGGVFATPSHLCLFSTGEWEKRREKFARMV